MRSFDHAAIESKWRERWLESPFARAVDGETKRPKFYALVEFPYPSGTGLHIGHAFANTILDVFTRRKRMAGYNVLFPMGWDAFGLPTENYAIRTGIHPKIATQQNTDRFREQMKRLAFAYDWQREINTTDPSYYKWTQWIFLQLFKHGLAYKQKMPINWCPACKIGLANEEVVDGKCERCGAAVERRELDQWLLRITAYADRLADELDLVDFPESVKAAQRNWIGRTSGVTIDYPIVGHESEMISCYSTRPDTNFGATFVVIAPEHPRVLELTTAANRPAVEKYLEEARRKSELERTEIAKEKTGVFTGTYCLNRLTDKEMPLWVADFVVATAGTGVVVGVPAHDERDFAFAKKYGLEIIPVITPEDGSWDFAKAAYTDVDYGTVINSDFLNGLSIKEAIVKISDYLVEKGWGKPAVNYHLRDWIFSRQHYWGEPIPMVYCPTCAEKGITWWETEEGKSSLENDQFSMTNFPASPRSAWRSGGQTNGDSPLKTRKLKIENFDLAGWFPVPESELPVELPEIEKYQPTGTGESPLAAMTAWVETACPHCGGPARRETDTMPNWAGSSWYFLRYCDSRNDQAFADRGKLDYWLPVDLYLGGSEHTTLHLLYSRFWHKFLNDLGIVPGKEPYAQRRVHGVILGEDGFRMSKSRGNVANPEDVIEKLGVDTLRLYLMFMGPYDETMPWSTEGVQGCHRFLNRVWRLVMSKGHPELDKDSHPELARLTARQVSGSTSEIPSQARDDGVEVSLSDRSDPELERELHRVIQKVGEDIEAMKFNTAIAALMGFLNVWEDQPAGLSSEDVGKFLLILAPFAPYLTEELWGEVLGREFSIHAQAWPVFDAALAAVDAVEIAVQVNGKLRGVVTLPSPEAKDQAKVSAAARQDPKIASALEGKAIVKEIFVPSRILNFVIR